MCGICGIVDNNKNPRVGRELIHKMCSCLIHRGPDDEGVYISQDRKPFVGLGHRRLSIIDLSEAGHQPMSNEDGSIQIVLNGEIYNYKDLRRDLEKNGHRFRSDSDTEVILHLYEEYQEGCLKYLRGMFAFALWDSGRKIIFLARDRAGKKPLLYAWNKGVFVFASEFSSLFASGYLSKDINLEAMDDYLTFGYVPAPATIYKDIFKLLPGEFMIVKEDHMHKQKYWQLDYSKKVSMSESEAADHLLCLLKEATRIRLYSDVPLGAFLSGGIDSSTVVGLMSRLSDRPVKTFSIGFEEKGFSELDYARKVAAKFDTDHNEFIVKPNAMEVLPLLVERYGEPFADSSCIPTYYVSQQTRRHVTVALCGDGGDELFAGYERYQAMLAAEQFRKLPLIFQSVIRNSLMRLPDSADQKNIFRNIKRVATALNLPTAQRYLRWVGIFDAETKRALYSESFKHDLKSACPVDRLRPYFDEPGAPGMIDRLLLTDTNTYLPYDLLVKVDIASMANSLEVRSPFLDHKVMEFAASLPGNYKIKNLVKKYILKKAIKGLVPEENIHRRKMGFGVPVGEWFRNELKGLLEDVFCSGASSKRGYFDPQMLESMVKRHVGRKADYTYQIWTLLTLELWHRKFID